MMVFLNILCSLLCCYVKHRFLRLFLRFLSFLLLIYSTLDILRDVVIFFAPVVEFFEDDATGFTARGGKTALFDIQTITSSYSDYESKLPDWENRYYVEVCISVLGVYVALLGIKATAGHISAQTSTDHIVHIAYIARRFLILLGVLGVSWTTYTFYCYTGMRFNIALVEALGELYAWVVFVNYAFRYYSLIKETEASIKADAMMEAESNERVEDSLTLLSPLQCLEEEEERGSVDKKQGGGDGDKSSDGIGDNEEQIDLVQLQREDWTIA